MVQLDKKSCECGRGRGRLKMREWKNRHDFAGVKNAGVETSGKIDTDAECYAGVCREKNG